MNMEESHSAKNVLCTKPGDKSRGTAKLRWCDELEEDIACVGCRNWRTNAQSLTMEIKSHLGT